jgi:hypothetical protein
MNGVRCTVEIIAGNLYEAIALSVAAISQTRAAALWLCDFRKRLKLHTTTGFILQSTQLVSNLSTSSACEPDQALNVIINGVRCLQAPDVLSAARPRRQCC